MKKIYAIILSMFLAHLCTAQQAVVKGNVRDTLNQVQLHNTVIALLQAKDSILYKFTRSDEKGHFELKGLRAGKYVIMISHPSFADYVEPLTLSDTSAVQLGKVILTQRSRLLQEVVIQQKVAAIKMKGDTTEFNAASFKTAANASVEDLLKKLPGIQVDSKGQITAQGETVKKVLVDGEEFFGDDPTLVTKNLRADMVDKVQLYDKKSDQSNFTGIDDGQKTKTINIQLKEDKKKGYFGKLALGAGPDGFHENQAMFNLFKGKKKFSVFGIASNTGKIGLDWGDREKFGSGSGEMSVTDDGDMMFSYSGDDLDRWDGRFNGDGYPLVQTGGLHYNNKWDRDRQNMNANYKIMQLYVDGNKQTLSQNILPDKTYYNRSNESFKNSIFRNRLNGSYEIQVDSSSSIKLSVDGSIDHKISQMNTSSNMQLNDQLINANSRNTSSASDIGGFNSNMLWKKKLKKKGRTISLDIAENYNRTNGDGNLYALTDYYGKGIIDSTQKIDQAKKTNNESVNLVTNLTYTEPLSKASSLAFNYGVIVNNNHSNRSSFNRGTDGKYSSLDSLYSNDYAFNVLTHKGGLTYNFSKDKLKVNIGSNVGFTDYNQKDMFRDRKMERSFVNWYPRASFRYSLSQQRRLSFNYNGNTQQPSMNQIQPIQVNDDPLNIIIGNPELKPSFNNSFNVSYSEYKVMSGNGYWVSFNYQSTSNAISDRSIVDASGKRTSQAVNVNGNRNARLYLNTNWKIAPIDTRVGVRMNGGLNRNVNFVNGLENITRATDVGLGYWIGKYVEKKYDVSLDMGTNYNHSVSSVDNSLTTQYWTFNINPSGDVSLPAHIQLHADMNYNIRQKTKIFTGNNNAAILNAFVAKKFGKKELVQINLAVNDILNQNIGFQRSVNTNTITQTTQSTIGRYAMLSFIWNFNKLGPGSAKE
ncbi:outer membrane beta-barrel protein [Chitinophaga sp. 212800010-3]|uniref:outer membrane beta-barrel protein n=1 Tax=unclassified Chitinophaga TaxID=2619133 RepID=UPI002DEE4EC7|nr:TonB-dependent receptor [Chitinophaga sp. 212800010-3]